MIRADYARPAAMQTFRASRLAFLEILIAACVRKEADYRYKLYPCGTGKTV